MNWILAPALERFLFRHPTRNWKVIGGELRRLLVRRRSSGIGKEKGLAATCERGPWWGGQWIKSEGEIHTDAENWVEFQCVVLNLLGFHIQVASQIWVCDFAPATSAQSHIRAAGVGHADFATQ
jgi:hypothetical protein